MKDIKCPLCGEEMKLKSNVYGDKQQDLYYYECSNCPLATMLAGNVEDAEEVVKVLISKFPPIMQLNVGDSLTYFGTSDFVTVVRKDMESCEIQIETPEGELYIIEPKDVLIAHGLRTKRSARKYIEFYKEEYDQKENMYEILVSDGKEASND